MSMSTVSLLILLDSNYFLAQCFAGNHDDLNGFKSKVNRHLVTLGPFLWTQSLILHEMLTFTGCLTLGKLRECKDILRTNELQKMKIEKFSFQNFEFPCFLGKYNSSY